MISQEKHLMIRHHVRQGEPVAHVARRFNVSRQTVYNHLNRKGPFPQKRTPRGSKLDPFKAYIDQRLGQFDLPATVIFREIKQRGYPGGVTTVRDYVRAIKTTKVQRLTERFETAPGKQAQLDWGECGSIQVDGKPRKLYVFVFVLGFSRMLFARFTTSTKRHVLFACMQEAFECLGRTSEVLVDNMKQAVDAHPVGEAARFNREFLDFCQHYDVAPLAAPPYWPRVKGKVERSVGYIKRSFLEGRSFVDLADLNRQLDVWLELVANTRIHGTTGEVPAVRYERERPHLRPTTAVPCFDTRPIEMRQVHSDSHIRYDRVLYSVHPDAVDRTVVVRASTQGVGDSFEVYLGERLVATHTIAPRHRQRVTLPEHDAEIRRRSRSVPKGRRTGPVPHFRQTPVPQVDVQTRSLTQYQAILDEEAA